MACCRWTNRILGVFLALYVVVGLIDQFVDLPDVYPFSDWYLYSFVSRYGEFYDVKTTQADGQTTYLSTVKMTSIERADVFDDLARVVKLRRKGNEAEAKRLFFEVLDRHRLDHASTLSIARIERLKFYQTGERESEDEFHLDHH